ncbi:MAG TPA: NADH-quinone oxidoreductase subunit L [Polyangiaceae bacterium]|jgi:NADH-quinone oxidoreductase subunit L|nr:NADH-quinone oxidoreductase subunit L [Polyangiaceae bacterium]
MLSLFPANDYALIAVILGMPLLGAFVNGIWGKRLGDSAVKLMTLTAIGVSFIAALIAFVDLAQSVSAESDAHVRLSWTAWEWMHTTGGRDGQTIPIDVKFSIDQLNGIMMLVVTGVGFLIHLYACSYMAGDKGYARFFAYLNLFVFSMLVLILGDNLPILFVGWEGVGLCSYLLIGFWYEVSANAAAGKKAFIANRVGDFGLLCAMFLLAHYTGALDWNGIANGATNLVHPGEPWRVHVWPVGGASYGGVLHFLQPAKPFTISAATAVGLALLLGCTGKSAQIPLYVWLPDAMAGPTPVSALIHAATMVTAGVYLVCRLSFVFVLSPFTMMVIAIIGAATAFLAATIALVQYDIKKVLAYSTVSQLGFMFLGVGVGAFTAGFFHVFTHAFFKACLFLGAGSVIHAMHGRIHDDVKSQDMRSMGGLRKWMPYTHGTFAVATAAIIGFPFTSGFFSKDEILYRAFVNHTINPMASSPMMKHVRLYEPPEVVGHYLYAVAVIAAAMTAFYMCRLYIGIFWGDFKGWTVGRPSLLAKQEVDGDHEHDDHHHEEDLSTPGHAPHESPWQMTVPLMVLAAFSAFAGFLNPGFGIFKTKPLDHWLEPVFKAATEGAVVFGHGNDVEWAEGLERTLAIGGIGAFLVGTGIAFWMYMAQKGKPAAELEKAFPRLHQFLLDKWLVDELYENTVIAMVDSLADTSAVVDKSIVDGVIARLSSLVVAASGTILRAFQNGVVHVYAAMMVVGIAFMAWFFAMPHASTTVTSVGNDDFVVNAAPGVGYAYRWDADGDGNFDQPNFVAQDSVKLHLEPGKSVNVGLEVRNAFGMVQRKTIAVAAPQAPVSSL